MLEVISGYLFVVVGILVGLYPLYLVLLGCVSWYLGSVSNGEWRFKVPLSVTLKEFEDRYGWELATLAQVCYLFAAILGVVIMVAATGNKPDSFAAWGLDCIALWYQVGVCLTYPVFIVIVLGALHTTLKKVHSLVSKIKQLTDKAGE